MKENQVLYGFKLLQQHRLPIATYYEFQHLRTGASFVRVANDDPDNLLAITFKTLPQNSTGVAHILEHMVLCGSERYPVRDPFFSMLNGKSIAKFLNAFTANDWTSYPFVTSNREDFFHLMSVYMDAVLHPLLTKEAFEQEAWRVRETNDGQLELTGVVFNEMQGAMSSIPDIVSRVLVQRLFPENVYRCNSGGDPKKIPKLTHKQLRLFHQTYYHPSNMRILTYGSFSHEDTLRFLQGILNDFERLDIPTDIKRQTRWNTPRKFTCKVPIGPKDDPDEKGEVCIGWLTTSVTDIFDSFAMSVLAEILLGNPASPLRKELVESGLGTDLSSASGMPEDCLQDVVFAVGLEGINTKNANKIRKIIFHLLEKLVEDGIDQELIEAAIHQYESAQNEISDYPYPYGIQLLFQVVGPWMHGGDLCKALDMSHLIESLKERLQKNAKFFEGMIRKYLLHNPHHVLLIAQPDREFNSCMEEERAKKMATLLKHYTPKGLEKLRERERILKQPAHDDSNCLPSLAVSSISPMIAVPEFYIRGESYIHYPALTFGKELEKGYVTLAGSIGKVPPELMRLVPFYCFCLSRLGTNKRDRVETQRWIARNIDGFSVTHKVATDYQTGDCLPYVAVNSQCLKQDIAAMVQIFNEKLMDPNFDDLEYLGMLLAERKAYFEGRFIPAGHRFAAIRARSQLSASTFLAEQWNGIAQFLFLKDLKVSPTLIANLRVIHKAIFRDGNIALATFGAMPERDSNEILVNFPHRGDIEPLAVDLPEELLKEGWVIPAMASYAAQACKIEELPVKDKAAIYVANNLISGCFLHHELREVGGAYGGGSMFNPVGSVLSFYSYRDPRINETLATFEAVRSFLLEEENFTQQNVDEAIVRSIAELYPTRYPLAFAASTFRERLTHHFNEAEGRFKRHLLAVSCNDVKKTASYFSGMRDTVVLANRELLSTTELRLCYMP